jgi:hypothetical protein
MAARSTHEQNSTLSRSSSPPDTSAPPLWPHIFSVPRSAYNTAGGIKTVRVPRPTALYFDWPASSPEIKLRLVIDFDADPLEVAGQDPMAFTAIRPLGPF